MNLIVCDTGPILHLMEAGCLELLQKTGKICIPEIVGNEIVALFPRWRKDKPEWITVESLLPTEVNKVRSLFLSGLLDMGEAGAIILAKRLKPKWFLTDDTEARIFASSLGLEVHGSLGIVLWLAAAGYLDYIESERMLYSLSKTSLWISKDIISEAQMALKKIFEV